jgi:hypothetical protein
LKPAINGLSFQPSAFPERLCPILEGGSLNQASLFYRYYIAFFSWKERVNCNFEKKKSYHNEVFKLEVKRTYLSLKKRKRTMAQGCSSGTLKKKTWRRESRAMY